MKFFKKLDIDIFYQVFCATKKNIVQLGASISR